MNLLCHNVDFKVLKVMNQIAKNLIFIDFIVFFYSKNVKTLLLPHQIISQFNMTCLQFTKSVSGGIWGGGLGFIIQTEGFSSLQRLMCTYLDLPLQVSHGAL